MFDVGNSFGSVVRALRARASVFLLVASIAFMPSPALAFSFVQALGLFHIVFGLLLTFTLLIFGTGLVVYLARFNTWPSHREAAIVILEWGVAMLFMLVVLLAIVNFFQNHSAIALPILAFIIVVIVAIIIIKVVATPKKAAPAKPVERQGH